MQIRASQINFCDMQLQSLPDGVFYYIATFLDCMSYDSLRCVSPRLRSIIKPLEYNVSDNPVAVIVKKISSYGGWMQLQKHLSLASIQSPKMYCDCLGLCVYKAEGIPLPLVQSGYTEKEWIELLYKFISVCILHHAVSQSSVSRFLSKFTPAQLHAAIELLWIT